MLVCTLILARFLALFRYSGKLGKRNFGETFALWMVQCRCANRAPDLAPVCRQAQRKYCVGISRGGPCGLGHFN